MRTAWCPTCCSSACRTTSRASTACTSTSARPEGADQATEVARLEGLGATHVDVGQGDVPWVVMADPEGNELCVLPAYPPEVQAQWQAQYDAYRRP